METLLRQAQDPAFCLSAHSSSLCMQSPRLNTDGNGLSALSFGTPPSLVALLSAFLIFLLVTSKHSIIPSHVACAAF